MKKIGYPEQVEMLMQVHYGRLTEKERRHYAGVEAAKLERGGVSYISRLLGINRNTIMKGKKELEQFRSKPDEEPDDKRQRKVGGGRKKNFRPI